MKKSKRKSVYHSQLSGFLFLHDQQTRTFCFCVMTKLLNNLLIPVSLITAIFMGCTAAPDIPHTELNTVIDAPAADKDVFVSSTETAHNATGFRAHQAIAFDLTLRFGGNERLKGRMTLLTNSNKGSIDMTNGDRIIFRGDSAFRNAEMSKPEGLRFAAYTWPYFFLFPYKLSDVGTQWEPFSTEAPQDKALPVRKLTFTSGTGDAPDDWYVVYADSATHLIQYAAYIVTASKGIAEAEKDPHAITYSNYTTISGVPIATKWGFFEWRPSTGLGKQLGDADISNLTFVDEPSSVFDVPNGFVFVGKNE